MGLGGIARDSMGDLDKLVQDDSTDDDVLFPRVGGRRHSNEGIIHIGGEGVDDDVEGGVAAGDDHEEEEQDDDDVDIFPGFGLSRVASFQIPLTDNLASSVSVGESTTTSASNITMGTTLISISETPISPPATSSSSSRISGAKLSSRYGEYSSSATTAAVVDQQYQQQQAVSRYQGFTYEGYADYYSDDYAAYSFDNSTDGSSASQQQQPQEAKNIFCCLFAPWMQRKALGNEEDDDEEEEIEKDLLPTVISSGQGEEEVGIDDAHIEDVVDASESSTPTSANMVLDSPTLTPTPSIDEKITPSASSSSSIDSGCESAPSSEPMELPNLHSNARTPKTSKNFDAVISVEELDPSCFLPMHDVGPSSSTPSIIHEEAHHSANNDERKKNEEDHHPTMNDEEKKQEEGDQPMHNEKKQAEGEEPQKHVVVPVEEKEEPVLPPPPPKGILKVWCTTTSIESSIGRRSVALPTIRESSIGRRTVMLPPPTTKESSIGRRTVMVPTSPNKRQLFPTYEQKNPNAEAKSIQFKPTARVLTIPSRYDIPLQQKAQVWWQKCDYDEFKKTGRIISKAMECGGSEIWLASSNAWGNKSARISSLRERGLSMSTNTSNNKQSEEYRKALSKYVSEDPKKEDDDNNSDAGDFGNKWWCKFGHSRRGLEHVVSSSEGKARQQSVLLAIRMVMEEQQRQRASRTKDPNKLRSVAMQYTSWAKDLALAAGAADAEAVASNFDPSAACRAQHFAKRLNVNSTTLHTIRKSEIGGGVAMAITSQILDANTHRTPIVTTTRKSSKKVIEHLSSPQASNSTVEHSRLSLSQRAKGFMPGAVDDVSAAALLSGMGNMGFRSVKA